MMPLNCDVNIEAWPEDIHRLLHDLANLVNPTRDQRDDLEFIGRRFKSFGEALIDISKKETKVL